MIKKVNRLLGALTAGVIAISSFAGISALAAETEIPEAKTVSVKQETGTWGFTGTVANDADGSIKLNSGGNGSKAIKVFTAEEIPTETKSVHMAFSLKHDAVDLSNAKSVMVFYGKDTSEVVFAIGSRSKTSLFTYGGGEWSPVYSDGLTVPSNKVVNDKTVNKDYYDFDLNISLAESDTTQGTVTGTISQNGMNLADVNLETNAQSLAGIYAYVGYKAGASYAPTMYLKDFRIYDDSSQLTYQADIAVNENGEPCSNADVIISGDSIENTKAVCNNGIYSVKLPAGTYTYTAKLAGYEDQTGEITVDEKGTVTAPEVSFSYPTASKVSVKQPSTGTWGFDANVQAGTGIDAGAIRTAYSSSKKSIKTIEQTFTQNDVVKLAFSMKTGIDFGVGRKGILSLTGDNNEGDFIFTIGARGHKNTSSERYIGYAAGTDYTEYSGSNIPTTGKINQTAEYLDVELTIDYPQKKITGSISQNGTEKGTIDYTTETDIPLLKSIYGVSFSGAADLYLKDFIIYDGNYTGTYTPTGIRVQTAEGSAIENADVYVENANTKRTKVQYNTAKSKYMVNLGSDLGEHTVTVSAEGYKSATATIQPGEENKTITLELMPKITGAVIQTADYTPSADTVLTEVVNGEDKGTIAYKDLPEGTLTTVIIKVENPKAGVNPTVTAAEVAYKATATLDGNNGFYIYQFLGDINLEGAVVSYGDAENVTITTESAA